MPWEAQSKDKERRVRMTVYDLHCHTVLSDGEMTLDEVIAKAKAGGYKTGVSDHLFADGNNTIEDIRHYLDTYEKYEIPLGGEANLGDPVQLPEAEEARFDYIIASTHAVYPESGKIALNGWLGQMHGYDEEWDGYDTERAAGLLELSYKQMTDFFGSHRAEILGHSNMMPFYDDLPYDSKEVIDWEKAVVALCKKYGVALEISGMWNRPFERMLRLAKSEGLKFSFGSDAHDIRQAGNLKYCLEMAGKLGLTDDDLFIPVF